MKPKEQIRILVVDDQKSMRALAVYFLKQLEFSLIDEAESAKDALTMMQKARYDLLILDWNLEGMSGVDLTRALRGVPELDAVKIIMATSERSVEKMNEALSAGANHYVVKPYQGKDLELRINKVMA